MSDKYLFEKEGDAPDIKRLERLLSVYKIEPVPPSLGQGTREKVERGRLFGLRFSHALMASLAIALISFAIWAGFISNKGRHTATIRSSEEMPFRDDTNISATSSIAEVQSLPAPAFQKHNSHEQPTFLTKVKSSRIRRQTTKSQTAKVKLTPEEKHAYQQVLIALWITGSKLKVVQDTINGVNNDK